MLENIVLHVARKPKEICHHPRLQGAYSPFRKMRRNHVNKVQVSGSSVLTEWRHKCFKEGEHLGRVDANFMIVTTLKRLLILFLSYLFL